MGRFWYRLSPLIGLLLFAAALWVLTREIRHLSIHSVTDAIRGLPPSAILAALGFTFLNYFILTGYDQLAFIYIRRPIARVADRDGVVCRLRDREQRRLRAAFGHLCALPLLLAMGSQRPGDLAGRHLLFRHVLARPAGRSAAGRWRIGAGDGPRPLRAARHRTRDRLAVDCGTAAAYPIVALFRRAPVTIGGMPIPMPTSGWSSAAVRALRARLEPGGGSPLRAAAGASSGLRVFPRRVPGRQLIALVSHVPGGLGVFESLMILLLAPAGADACLPALAMFRVIYYLLPLGVALGVLTIDEFYQRRHHVGQWGNAFGTLTTAVAPKLLAVFMMLARRRADVLGRHADRGRAPRLGQRLRAPSGASSCRTSSAASSASGCSSSRGGWRGGSTPPTCFGRRRARRRHRRVAAEGRRLRGGARAFGAARGALRQPRGVRSQGGALRHPVLAGMGDCDAARSWPRRSASDSSRSATSSARTTCGGGSRSEQDAPRFLRATVGVLSR